MAFINKNRSPNMDSPACTEPVKVSNIAPVAPIIIPTARINEGSSLSRKNERIATIIGFMLIMIPELIEEDKFSP